MPVDTNSPAIKAIEGAAIALRIVGAGEHAALISGLEAAAAEVARLAAENTKLALNAQNALDVVGAEVARLTAETIKYEDLLRDQAAEISRPYIVEVARLTAALTEAEATPNPFILMHDAAKEARKEEREKVAAWMIQHSFAIGHGDTLNDLLVELSGQVGEIGARSQS